VQSEYVVKLRALEDELLGALNNAQGNILDNEPVIKTLESLKQQSTAIQ